MVATGMKSKTDQQQQQQLTPDQNPLPTEEVRNLKQQITRMQVENSAALKENEALRARYDNS